MKNTSPKEMEAVLRLDGAARYEHFIKRVADSERAWGLWKDGWALMGDNQGHEVFPLWPASEYAELSKGAEWADYQPEPIPLDRLLSELLPMLQRKGVLPGVFPTPSDKATTPSAGALMDALRLEAAKYE